MTTSTTAQSNTETQEHAQTAGHEVGTIVHVAPDSLLLQRNVREAKPDADLIRSIKAIGVLEPITAVLTPEGGLLVRYGHRRTLAAIEAASATVPVYVTGQDATDNAAEINRIIAQRDENTHRAGLGTADDVAIVETLTGLGLSAAQVAKQARIKRTDVDTALAVAGSKIARKAAERYEALTLEQAATVAEFEDDTDTVKALIVAATEGRFEHVAQRARDDRATAQAKGALLDALEAEGVSVIERPGYDDTKTLPLDRLRANAEARDRIAGEVHRACPGHVVWVGSEWAQVDAQGNPINEVEEPDKDADEAAWEAYEQECDRLRATSRQVQRPAPIYGCSGWRTHGHIDAHAYSTGSSKPKAADMSEQERDAAKAERRLVVENNKAWSAAEPVRREYVATLAKAKTPPKGAARFIATALCKDSGVTGSTGGSKIAADWLGVKHVGYGMADLAPAKTATENRALVIALVQILGGYEAALTKDSWRHDGTHNTTGRYLRFLETSGYGLSDVEKYATSKNTA